MLTTLSKTFGHLKTYCNWTNGVERLSFPLLSRVRTQNSIFWQLCSVNGFWHFGNLIKLKFWTWNAAPYLMRSGLICSSLELMLPPLPTTTSCSWYYAMCWFNFCPARSSSNSFARDCFILYLSRSQQPCNLPSYWMTLPHDL